MTPRRTHSQRTAGLNARCGGAAVSQSVAGRVPHARPAHLPAKGARGAWLPIRLAVAHLVASSQPILQDRRNFLLLLFAFRIFLAFPVPHSLLVVSCRVGPTNRRPLSLCFSLHLHRHRHRPAAILRSSEGEPVKVTARAWSIVYRKEELFFLAFRPGRPAVEIFRTNRPTDWTGLDWTGLD